MENERIILGLDVGMASVGYGLVKLQEEKYLLSHYGTDYKNYMMKVRRYI